MNEFTVNITLSPATLAALTASGYTLYGLQAVSSSDKAAVPTAWFATTDYRNDTQVTWTDAYQAYISTTAGTIIEINAVSLNLGETANVDAEGTMSVIGQGTPGAISINNLATPQWTAGIVREFNGVAAPICAQPLYGMMLAVVAPINKALFMFATESFGLGVPVLQSYAPAILIDLTAVSGPTVAFDIDDGWNWGGKSWATQIPAGQNIVPYLISRG